MINKGTIQYKRIRFLQNLSPTWLITSGLLVGLDKHLELQQPEYTIYLSHKILQQKLCIEILCKHGIRNIYFHSMELSQVQGAKCEVQIQKRQVNIFINFDYGIQSVICTSFRFLYPLQIVKYQTTASRNLKELDDYPYIEY